MFLPYFSQKAGQSGAFLWKNDSLRQAASQLYLFANQYRFFADFYPFRLAFEVPRLDQQKGTG
jgi:hypothetical protein